MMIIQASASSLSGVPNYAEGWENDFIIPSQYSEDTMAALRNKKIGDKHRHEIVQEICSRMINVCKYPTSKQRKIVATKLTLKFPQQETPILLVVMYVSNMHHVAISPSLLLHASFILTGFMGYPISNADGQFKEAWAR